MASPDKQDVFQNMDWINQDCRFRKFIDMARDRRWIICRVWSLLGGEVDG